VGVSDPLRGWVDRIAIKPAGPGVKDLEGSFTPRWAGHFVLVPFLPEGSNGCKKLSASVAVTATDVERLHPEADHEFLRMLAARTGGRFFRSVAQAGEFASAIPDRSVQVADDLEEPLGDKGFVIAFFSVLIVTEWVLRKVLGLT
jgi:hypothetical protein